MLIEKIIRFLKSYPENYYCDIGYDGLIYYSNDIFYDIIGERSYTRDEFENEYRNNKLKDITIFKKLDLCNIKVIDEKFLLKKNLYFITEDDGYKSFGICRRDSDLDNEVMFYDYYDSGTGGFYEDWGIPESIKLVLKKVNKSLLKNYSN